MQHTTCTASVRAVLVCCVPLTLHGGCMTHLSAGRCLSCLPLLCLQGSEPVPGRNPASPDGQVGVTHWQGARQQVPVPWLLPHRWWVDRLRDAWLLAEAPARHSMGAAWIVLQATRARNAALISSLLPMRPTGWFPFLFARRGRCKSLRQGLCEVPWSKGKGQPGLGCVQQPVCADPARSVGSTLCRPLPCSRCLFISHCRVPALLKALPFPRPACGFRPFSTSTSHTTKTSWTIQTATILWPHVEQAARSHRQAAAAAAAWAAASAAAAAAPDLPASSRRSWLPRRCGWRPQRPAAAVLGFQ
jgi:hypothetical protein